jgi:transcription termination factor Rho
MTVLDREALEASPLADLHAIASELSIDGYRRLRRPELIDAILGRQAGEEPAPSAEDEQPGDVADEAQADSARAIQEQAPARRRRGRRGGRGRGREEGSSVEEEEVAEEAPATAGRATSAPEDASAAAEGAAAAPEDVPARTEDEIVTGVVELLPNGSGFVRVQPPEPSDEDVYISAAQVKRCELVSGDRISGPRRAPRHSERFASLIRVDTVNDRSAAELADSTRFDDLPAAFPTERFRLGSEDPTLEAINQIVPIGRGSRVTIVGLSRAGKTETLRRLAAALTRDDQLQISVALAGVRPEEISEWSGGSPAPTAAVSLTASPDAQAAAVELAVDQGRRVAARGANAVVLIDSLDGLHQHAARKALAAARNIVDGGSLTVIATSSEPIGGETSVIALDRGMLANAGWNPALDPAASGTIRAELLVGGADAEAAPDTPHDQ